MGKQKKPRIMRRLDLDEISDIVSRQSSDIMYSDINHLEIKINQFLNLLFDQPISNRTLKGLMRILVI